MEVLTKHSSTSNNKIGHNLLGTVEEKVYCRPVRKDSQRQRQLGESRVDVIQTHVARGGGEGREGRAGNHVSSQEVPGYKESRSPNAQPPLLQSSG